MHVTSFFRRETDGGTVLTVPTSEIKEKGGALQIRWKLPTGGKVSVSERYEWMGPEKGHYHQGLSEVYTVHAGSILMYMDVVDVDKRFVRVSADARHTLVVDKFVNHFIASCSGTTVFVTQTLGAPVPNPQRNNNDWWVDPTMEGRLKEATLYLNSNPIS